MKQLLYVVTLSLIFSAFTSCSSGDKKKSSLNPDSPPQPEKTTTAPDSKTYKASGIVISIPPGKRNLIVKHDKIPGFMDAMTMPFPVRDSAILDHIKPKDFIKFTIQVNKGKTMITEIQKMESQ